MKNNQISVDSVFLQKFAEFTKLVMNRISALEDQVSYHQLKQANVNDEHERYVQSVIKVADALYSSDLEFVAEDFDRRKFIKRASEDKAFLAQTLIKVCQASDVASFGKPSKTTITKRAASYDPVYARAFGYSVEADNFLDID
jgi:hypothetical protein